MTHDYEVFCEDDTWYVVNHTKWGNKYLAEFSGPDAEEWANKYKEHLWSKAGSLAKEINDLKNDPEFQQEERYLMMLELGHDMWEIIGEILDGNMPPIERLQEVHFVWWSNLEK